MLRSLINPRVLLAAVVIAGLVTVALWPTTLQVDVERATRGPLVVTVDEEGMTRVRDRFVVSAPVSGRVLRIELEPGDRVTRGQVIARVRAEVPPLLDARTRAEAEAAVESARATLGRARADEERTKAELGQAQRELTRARGLTDSISRQELEAREADVRMAQESATAAAFTVRAATSELQRAEARLMPPTPDATGRVTAVVSPVNGVVLKRVRESESFVPAGDPLVEIGDPGKMEIVSDLLSTDAVRVAVGSRAIIDEWGGDRPLEARVRRIEPAGFMKVSALGVEEQRVNVVLDFADASVAARAGLGDGYRVEVRVVLWESADVLRVPTGALFRDGDRWAVYVVEGDRAHQTFVSIGHQTGQYVEVLSGMPADARVILHPGDTMTDNARVSERTAATAQ